MKTKNEIKYWSCNPEPEWLTDETIGEAVEQYLDELFEETMPIPEEIWVYGFSEPILPSARVFTMRMCEDLYQHLDETYGYEGSDQIVDDEIVNSITPIVQELIDQFKLGFFNSKAIKVKTRDYIDKKERQ